MLSPSLVTFLEDFLAADRPGRPELDTVLLSGSHAMGKAGPRSDIDLCYVGRFPGFRRESLRFRHREVQLMIGPWNWYRDVVQQHRWPGNVGTITVMLAHALPVWGAGSEWDALHALARHHWEQGPDPAGPEDIQRYRVHVTDLWDDWQDAGPGPTRSWLTGILLAELAEATYVLNRRWAVKPKYLLDDLAAWDPALAHHVRALLLRADDAPTPLLADIIDHVLEPIGGLMRGAWSHGV